MFCFGVALLFLTFVFSVLFVFYIKSWFLLFVSFVFCFVLVLNFSSPNSVLQTRVGDEKFDIDVNKRCRTFRHPTQSYRQGWVTKSSTSMSTRDVELFVTQRSLTDEGG